MSASQPGLMWEGRVWLCVCWGVGFGQGPRVRGPLSPPCPFTLWRESGHFVVLNLFSLSRYPLPFGD